MFQDIKSLLNYLFYQNHLMKFTLIHFNILFHHLKDNYLNFLRQDLKITLCRQVLILANYLLDLRTDKGLKYQ